MTEENSTDSLSLVLRTAAFYTNSDENVRSQSDDPRQLPIRRPFADDFDELYVGIVQPHVPKPGEDQGVTGFRLANSASLAAQHVPPETDLYQAANANFLQENAQLAKALASTTEAGPKGSDDAIRWVINQKPGAKYGKLLLVDVGGPSSTLLLLPAMVNALCRILKCPPTHLVATPYDENEFLAGPCTDPMAMCMLGDITSTSGTLAGRTPRPTFLTRTPFVVKDISDTDPTKPVIWRKYPCYGTPFGLVGYDREPQYVVPRTGAAADELGQGLAGGLPPPLMKIQHTDQCFGCGKAAGVVQLKGCAKCFTAVYCSGECQREDWKQHKPFCQKVVASGTLGTGPAGPTAGEAMLTPFTYRL